MKEAEIPPVAPLFRARRAIPMAVAIIALSLLSGCDSNLGLPEAASEQGRETAELWRLFFSTAVAVGGLVWVLIIWAVFRYRRRDDEMPKQTLANVPLEIFYTVVPLIIVGFLFAATMRSTSAVNALSADPDLVVEVTAFQWQWRFGYPQAGISVVGETGRPAEMVLPEGATVRMELTSADVIHAFWVPEFMVKRDAIPNRPTQFDITVNRAGTFDSGRCVEYCGLNHDDMSFVVRVVPQAEFDSWAASQRRSG